MKFDDLLRQPVKYRPCSATTERRGRWRQLLDVITRGHSVHVCGKQMPDGLPHIDHHACSCGRRWPA